MKKQRSVKKNIVVLLVAASFFWYIHLQKYKSFSGMSFKTEKSSFRQKFSIMSLEFK